MSENVCFFVVYIGVDKIMYTPSSRRGVHGYVSLWAIYQFLISQSGKGGSRTKQTQPKRNQKTEFQKTVKNPAKTGEKQVGVPETL